MNRQGLIWFGFVVGGLINIGGVLLFSAVFTNEDLARLSPLFSNFGLIIIILWGLAYIAVANQTAQVRWLVAVFALEKLAYGVTWLTWMSAHHGDIGQLISQSPMAGAFMLIYGPNDLAFAAFFLWAFFATRSETLPRSAPNDG
jgi:hypothetical protein